MTGPARWAVTVVAAAVAGCSAGEGSPVVGGSGRSGAFPLLALDAVARADSIVEAWVDAGRVAGAVFSVSQGGETVFARPYGHARRYDYGGGQYAIPSASQPEPRPPIRDVAPSPLERAEPVPTRLDTRYDLASVSKVMGTTFAVMLLVDRGLLDLDAPVHEVLADFVGGGKESITPRHLLTHRSGLAQWQPTYYVASDADAAYRYVRELPLSWPVGEGRHYSDLGFMVLGRIVEAVAGAPLDRFLATDLYYPLGLQRTGYRRTAAATAEPTAPEFAATSHGNPFEHRMVYDSTFGYRFGGDPRSWDDWRRRTLVGEVNDGNAYHAFHGVAGHAGLFSTADDLQRLLRLLLEGGTLDGVRRIDPDVVDTFLTDTGDGQALGWQVPADAPTGSFTHTGFTGTWVLGVPALDLGVVLLTTRQHGGVDETGRYPDVGPLQRAVAAALLEGGPGGS